MESLCKWAFKIGYKSNHLSLVYLKTSCEGVSVASVGGAPEKRCPALLLSGECGLNWARSLNGALVELASSPNYPVASSTASSSFESTFSPDSCSGPQFEFLDSFLNPSLTHLIHNGALTRSVGARIDHRLDWKMVPGVITLA